MLSYQHIYHAGNFADAHKHAVMVQILKAQRLKPAPLAVLDTHAGRGLYDLSCDEALKNREFEDGIRHLLDAPDSLLQPWLDIVRKYAPLYPGTAVIARDMLRPSERLICAEKHPGEFAELEKALAQKPSTVLHQKDGLQCLIESVPFPERRGLAVIDPSYEIKKEYDDLPRSLLQAWKKWPQGCYLVWYPLMEAGGHLRLLAGLRAAGIRDVLLSEIRRATPPQEHFRMYGSGLAIINPPWPETFLDELTRLIAARLPSMESGKVFWLDNVKLDPETGRLAL